MLYVREVLDRRILPLFPEAVLPLDPALEAALLTEGPRPEFKPCPICGGAVPADGAWPTVPSPAPGLLCGGKSGIICGKNGGDVWKIRPRKNRLYQGFPGPLLGRPYLSMAYPWFAQMLSTSIPALLDTLSRGAGHLRRCYSGRKSRLCDPPHDPV